jgi:hypothetical protein
VCGLVDSVRAPPISDREQPAVLPAVTTASLNLPELTDQLNKPTSSLTFFTLRFFESDENGSTATADPAGCLDEPCVLDMRRLGGFGVRLDGFSARAVDFKP